MTQEAAPECSDGADCLRPLAAEGVTADARPSRRTQRLRRPPGVGLVWRVGVFVLGTSLVLLGLVLSVVPGPLTIPPVLLGLWVLSTEFAWAHRFLTAFRGRARATWARATRRPVSSAFAAVLGLATAAAGVWALRHLHLVDQVRSAVGL